MLVTNYLNRLFEKKRLLKRCQHDIIGCELKIISKEYDRCSKIDIMIMIKCFTYHSNIVPIMNGQ